MPAFFFHLLRNNNASSMTTKMVVDLFIAVIKQCRYYNHTDFKIIAFKVIRKILSCKSWEQRVRLAVL